jgi:hypothetical protein
LTGESLRVRSVRSLSRLATQAAREIWPARPVSETAPLPLPPPASIVSSLPRHRRPGRVLPALHTVLRSALLGAATGLRLLGLEHSGDARALGWQLLSRRTSPMRRDPSGLRTTTVVALWRVRGGALHRRARTTRPGHQQGLSQERCPDQRRDDGPKPGSRRPGPPPRTTSRERSVPCATSMACLALARRFVRHRSRAPLPCRLLGSLMTRRGRSRGHANGPPDRWSNGPFFNHRALPSDEHPLVGWLVGRPLSGTCLGWLVGWLVGGVLEEIETRRSEG